MQWASVKNIMQLLFSRLNISTFDFYSSLIAHHYTNKIGQTPNHDDR